MKTAIIGHGEAGLGAMILNELAYLNLKESSEQAVSSAIEIKKHLDLVPSMAYEHFSARKPHHLNQRQRRKLARQTPNSKYSR